MPGIIKRKTGYKNIFCLIINPNPEKITKRKIALTTNYKGLF